MKTIDFKPLEKRLAKKSVKNSSPKTQKVEDMLDGIYFNFTFNEFKTEKYETLIFREKSKVRK